MESQLHFIASEFIELVKPAARAFRRHADQNRIAIATTIVIAIAITIAIVISIVIARSSVFTTGIGGCLSIIVSMATPRASAGGRINVRDSITRKGLGAPRKDLGGRALPSHSRTLREVWHA